MTRRLATPALILLLSVSPIHAQGPPAWTPLPDRLTVDEAIVRATATSHRLAELKARHGAAQAVVDERDAAQNPTIAAQLGYQRTNHVDEFGFQTATGFRVIYPDVPDNYRTRIELQWPIYTGGRLQALERAAAAEAGATGKDLDAARADLKLEVTRAFWAVVTARESARVVGEAVKRVEAQLTDVRSRFDAGFVPPNDVLTVEAQRARQQVLFIEAQNQAAVAEADLARLIGAPDGTPITLDAALDQPIPAERGPGSATLVSQAQANRPDRAAFEARIAAAGERQQAAGAGLRPTVSLLSGADYARPNPRIFPREAAWNPSWDVGVNVSWPLWDGGRTKAEVAEAAGLATAARERLAEFDRGLGVEIRQRSLDLEASRAQIGAAEEEVKSATEARRVVQERFTAGVATTTDLLDAQVALLQAELDRTRALASTRLALARLDRALGR